MTTGLIRPHSVYQGPQRRRDFFLFTFQQLVQLRIVAALRRTGVALQRIRAALDMIRGDEGQAEWHSLWLVSDGADVFVVREAHVLETLTGGSKGQLAFAVVAMGAASIEVQGTLARGAIKPFEAARYRGRVDRYRRVATP